MPWNRYLIGGGARDTAVTFGDMSLAGATTAYIPNIDSVSGDPIFFEYNPNTNLRCIRFDDLGDYRVDVISNTYTSGGSAQMDVTIFIGWHSTSVDTIQPNIIDSASLLANDVNQGAGQTLNFTFTSIPNSFGLVGLAYAANGADSATGNANIIIEKTA